MLNPIALPFASQLVEDRLEVRRWMETLPVSPSEKRDLDTVKHDLVREIGTLREGKMTDIAELRADVREIRHDVKTLLAR